jgi:arginyl-tRNA--protein-N-Asp/Glu arginylyltransferase
MKFKIKSYAFGQLAQLYYPDRNERSAIRLFREELLVTRGLKDALVALGYRRYNKILTRGQVQTIIQYLGEP